MAATLVQSLNSNVLMTCDLKVLPTALLFRVIVSFPLLFTLYTVALSDQQRSDPVTDCAHTILPQTLKPADETLFAQARKATRAFDSSMEPCKIGSDPIWVPTGTKITNCLKGETPDTWSVTLKGQTGMECGVFTFPVRSLSLPLSCLASPNALKVSTRDKNEMQDLDIKTVKFTKTKKGREFRSGCFHVKADARENHPGGFEPGKECGCVELDRVLGYMHKPEYRSKSGQDFGKPIPILPISCVTQNQIDKMKDDSFGKVKSYQALLQSNKLEAFPVLTWEEKGWSDIRLRYLSREGDLTKEAFRLISIVGGMRTEVEDKQETELYRSQSRTSSHSGSSENSVPDSEAFDEEKVKFPIPQTIEEWKISFEDLRRKMERFKNHPTRAMLESQQIVAHHDALIMSDNFLNPQGEDWYKYQTSELLDNYHEIMDGVGYFLPPGFHEFFATNRENLKDSVVTGATDPKIQKIKAAGEKFLKPHFHDIGGRGSCHSVIQDVWRGEVRSIVSIKFCPHKPTLITFDDRYSN